MSEIDPQLVQAWECLKKVNPHDPLAAARSYPRVMAALRWFIENDETNLWDPENEYWTSNFRRGKRVYRDASGGVVLRPEDDDPNVIRAVLHP